MPDLLNSNISETIEPFKDYLQNSVKNSYTKKAYLTDYKQFVEFVINVLKKNKINQVTRDDILSYLNYLSEVKKFSVRTVARKLNSLKTFFRFLEKKGELNPLESPLLGIKLPNLNNETPRYLKPIEYFALREASRSDLRLNAIFETLLQTGMRVGELTRLKLSDLRLTPRNKPYFYIEPNGSQPARIVPIPTKLYTLLQKYIKKGRIALTKDNDKGYLFVTKTGNPIAIRNVRQMIKRLMKKVGIKDATVNDIRNTFIIMQLKKGLDPLTIARIVGLKRLSSIERYLRVVEQENEQQNNNQK